MYQRYKYFHICWHNVSTACRAFLDLSTAKHPEHTEHLTYFTGYEHSGVRGDEEDREEGAGTDIKTKVGISREGSWYSHINQPSRENETSIGGFQLFSFNFLISLMVT